MYHDKIIEDVWRNRDEYSDEHNHNLSEIVADLQLRQKKRQNHKIIDRRHNKTLQVSQNDIS